MRLQKALMERRAKATVSLRAPETAFVATGYRNGVLTCEQGVLRFNYSPLLIVANPQ